MIQRSLLMFVVVGIVSFSANAGAQEAEAPKKPVEGFAGAKLFLGGNVWSTPGNIPGGYEGLGFAGSAGGFGWGVAAYGEARFIQHLGLELDLGYDNSTLMRNVKFNGVLDTKEKVTHSGPRIGLLFKGIANAPFGRLWLGLGPEFLLPSSTSAEHTAEAGVTIPGTITAKKKNSTMLTFGFGLVIEAGDKIEIPIELRAAKNMTQDSDWADRVKFNSTTFDYEVTAQNSWDFRLGLGAGYRF